MQQRQHNADNKHKHSNQHQHILLDKVLQRNIAHGLAIQRQIACQPSRRYSSQRLVQHGQQRGVAAVDSEGDMSRLRQKEGIQLFIISKSIQVNILYKKAIGLALAHCLLHLFTRSVFFDFPVRIVIGNIGLGKIIIPAQSHNIGVRFIEILARGDDRHADRHNLIRKHEAMLFCKIGIIVKMENHVDFAILQRLHHGLLRREALHRKIQPLLLKAARRIADIVSDNAGRSALLLIREEAALAIDEADADFAMLRQPCLLICGKHRHSCHGHVLLIQLLWIKRPVLLHPAHSLIQLSLEVRTVFVDRKIYIRAAHRRNR